MRLARALVALLLAVGSGSCQETPATDFTIRFALDPSAGGFCPSADCDAYRMRCGARLSVRILDTEDSITGRGELVRATCEEVASSDTLCSLKNTVDVKIFNVPLHHVRIEVAAWHPADLPDTRCPAVPFDLNDRPSASFRPRPAVAGAATFDVASDKVEVVVPLQCTNIARLDDVQCLADPRTLLRAQVDDLATGFSVYEPQAEELTVSAARPTPVDGSTTARRIDREDVIDLSRVLDGAAFPTFEHDYAGEMTGPICTVVLDSGPQVTATATCTTVEEVMERVDLRGLLVTTETLQPLLDAMGSAFPETGLVVGKVLDQSGTPLAGVRVIPSAGTVEYLDEAGTAFAGTTTSSRGYFISRDAPYGTTWRAIRVDGYVQQTVQAAGLVNLMVTPIIIRMVAPDAAPPEGDGGDEDDGDLGDAVP